MFERIQKIDRRTLAALAIAAVVAILAFSAIAGGIRQAGWNEGFLMGQLSSGGVSSGGEASAAAVAPYMRGHSVHGWGWHPFWIVGGFFRFLFFAFLIMLFFKFIARRRWARHGGHGHGTWGHHGSHHGRHRWSHHGAPEQPGTTEQQPNDPMPGDTHRPQQTGWTQV